MRDLLSPRSRPTNRHARWYAYLVFLFAALAMLVAPAAASAAGFKEKIASARWSTPFLCPDGSTATDGRLIVETDLFIEDGTEPDPNPPLRLGFTGQCPDGTFSWGLLRATPTTFLNPLRKVKTGGTFTGVLDNRGGSHTVSVSARWVGHGPIETIVNAPGSRTRVRAATATATVVFDGTTLVDGTANFPFPAPFIRVDTEK
jgi:hypothetical protein